MSIDKEDLKDVEIAQMLAAQHVVQDHKELHDEYVEQVKNYCDRLDVDLPDPVGDFKEQQGLE